MAPRPALVLAAEIGGICPVLDFSGTAGSEAPQRGMEWFFRLRSLVGRKYKDFPHPLFDTEYYLAANPQVRDGRCSPILHFLLWGGFEGRQPHPMFDPVWYTAQNSDVAACDLNPLQHYIGFGWREGRNPHPLFDVNWYQHAYPDVKAAGYDPLIHFLLWGGAEGRKPHPLFDAGWYLRRYPEVTTTKLNPLVHYLLHGAAKNYSPNRNFNSAFYTQQYPTSLENGSTPLTHYVTSVERGPYDPNRGFPRHTRTRNLARPRQSSLSLVTNSKTRTAPECWRNTFGGSSLPVFVVYGDSNVPFIESELVPSLAAQSCPVKLHLHAVNYKESRGLLSPDALAYSDGTLEGVTDWSAERENLHIGFGESVNYLFSRVLPESCFLLVNPDSMPMPGCVEKLLETFRERSAAFVEARQWPSEHPKEYDSATGWTPWASGAFVLMASRAFQQLQGFDPLYFLYNEDVDLSWRAWLQGFPVVYEPQAICAHFTGLLSYEPTRFYYEHFFSIRNFLVIAYKFYGEHGEQAAWRWIEDARLPASFRAKVEESYLALKGQIRRVEVRDSYHADKLKILGLNLYHQLR